MNSLIKDRIDKIGQGIVPEGYKKTKIGIIPEDWNVEILEKLCTITTGNKDTQDKEDKGKNPFFVRSNNIERINSYSYDGEAILTAGDGVGTGKVFHYINGKFDYHQRVYCLNQFENVNGKYIYYYFSENFIRQVVKYTAKTSVDSVRREMITKMNIPISKLKEQEKIANILSTWDKAIENIEKLIKEKEIQKKGLMQQLLTGETRLHGFTEEWKEVKLQEVTERITEKNNEKTDNVLTISAEDGLVNQEKYYTKQIASQNLDNYTYLKKGDFAYNKSYSKGYPMGTIKMLELFEDGVVSSLYICFESKDNVDKNYLKQYFDANMFNHGVYKIAQEGARNHGLLNIGIKDFFDIKLKLPQIEEQKAIAEILSTADKEIELLKQLLANKKEEKKGLMQLLLTGIVRV